ncbi:xin actin-binding repeat-containing protein 1 isoform X3 [Pteropus vampyrus]|nr:xin actin-binding repeat-containing protein 1 isoform X3 [Pteropus vampyrus]
MSPRKKPQLPPKPAYLSQLPPPQRLPKPSARSLSSSQGEYKLSETDAAIPQPAKVPTTAGQGRESLTGCPNGQNQPSPQHGPSIMASRPTKSQAVGCSSQSPEPPKFSALSSDPTSLQQNPSPLEEKLTESSQQEASQSPKILQGSQQELQSLLNEVQALEKEAASSVDVRALRRLFEAVPQLGGAPQAPATPRKPEASVEQAFGELRKVSTEVARLKEQTLARLLDIEEAVHKALSSMSNLQPEANTRGHSRGPSKDHSPFKVSVINSSKARPNCTGQEVRGQTAVKSQTEATCHPEVQNQAKVRNHTGATGQAVSTTPSTRRLETLREDLGLPRVLPSTRDSPSSPTCISIQSPTRKLPKAPSPGGSPEVTENTRLAQDVSQALLHQKGVLDKAGEQEVAHCSGQPKPAPAPAGPLPSMQQKCILELQTRPGSSQHYGATRTEQYEGADESRNTVLASSATVMGQAGSPRGPDPHLGLQASPLLRQFLHSPAGLRGDLAEAQRVPVPCGHSQPAAH